MKTVKKFFNKNKLETCVFFIILFGMIFLSIVGRYAYTHPKPISPHDSEEICNKLGGDYIKYRTTSVGTPTVITIYKCMEAVEINGEPRKEIDSKKYR